MNVVKTILPGRPVNATGGGAAINLCVRVLALPPAIMRSRVMPALINQSNTLTINDLRISPG